MLAPFHSIETFWRLFNNVPLCSTLDSGWNYRIFRNNILPQTEDVHNKQGGQWVLSINKKENLNKGFLELLLAIIGNTISEEDDINGIVVNCRNKYSRLSVWTSRGELDDRQQRLGDKIRELVPLADGNIVFKLHCEIVNKNNSAFLTKASLKA